MEKEEIKIGSGIWEQIRKNKERNTIEINPNHTMKDFLSLIMNQFPKQERLRKQELEQNRKDRKEFMDWIHNSTLQEVEDSIKGIENNSISIPGIGWVNSKFLIEFKKQYDNGKSRSRIV